MLRLQAVRLLIGWVPPFVAGRTRTVLLRAAGFRIGSGTAFFHLPRLLGEGNVHERLTVGAHCGFNKGTVFDLAAPITIGDYVDVGHDVMFLTSSAGVGLGNGDLHEAKPIVIGNGVWLGARTTIMPGVTVGAGSVIGAGVTVDEDVPENMLLSGAKPISIARWR